jgi:NAD(P) transhydrogenase subunit alpha
MKILVAKEVDMGERRVALVPDVVSRLVKSGLTVFVETGAGDRAFLADALYEAAGATIRTDVQQAWAEADVILKVGTLQERNDGSQELHWLRSGQVLISFLNPLGNPPLFQKLAERGVTTFCMELIPRISRAQSMDALSSQANIAGYKAALLGSAALPKYFPMLTTAAGTIAPAKVLVMGAGVAGLQAIATARRLGAVVSAFDIRPEVKDQVQSLGAKFVEVSLEEETRAEGGYAKELSQDAQERTRQVLTEYVQQSDVVITTALIPGKKAPILVTDTMLQGMKPGSVVVDLAAEQGGNCEGSQPGKDIQKYGVTIMGPINLPSSVPIHASQLYAKNLQALLQCMVKDKALHLDFNDEVIAGACVTHGGQITNERIQALLTSQNNSSSAVLT